MWSDGKGVNVAIKGELCLLQSVHAGLLLIERRKHLLDDRYFQVNIFNAVKSLNAVKQLDLLFASALMVF